MACQNTFLDQFLQRVFCGSLFDGRAQLQDVRLGKLSELVQRCFANNIVRGHFLADNTDPILKIPIGRKDRMQQISDERGGVFGTVIPAILTGAERVIIQLFALGDLTLKRDVFADHIAGAIEQQCRQQAAHTAIAVIERMDAEEVMDKGRDQDQRIDLLRVDDAVVALANAIDRPGCLKRRERRKDHIAIAVCVHSADIILCVLEIAADALFGIPVEIAVQLQDVVGVQRDIRIIFVDRVQHIPVTENLFFIPVAGSCFIGTELLQARACRADAFDLVGCLGAPDDRDLNKSVELCQMLLEIQLLPAFVFVNLCDQTEDLVIPAPADQI